MVKEVTGQELRTWLTEYIAKLTGEPVESIDTSNKMFEYDFDSIDSIRMAVELKEAFGIEVPLDTFFDGLTTLDELIDQLKSD